MTENYRALSAAELLERLAHAGRAPDLELIRACMDRRYDLTPGLLEMLAAPSSEDWADDDPRWYAPIHAGHLLIHFREAQAIKIFMRLLREPDADRFIEWFENALACYGLAILPDARALLNDSTVDESIRISVPAMLYELALEFPTERAQVIGILRDALPPVDSTGKLIIPKPRPEKPNSVWTFVALELAQLHDLASRPLIETLYRENWLDVSVMGDVNEYVKILTQYKPGAPQPFNLLETYEGMRAEAAKMREWQAQRDEVQRQQALLKAGAASELDPLTIAESEPTVNATVAPSPYVQDKSQTLRRAVPKVGRNDPCPCGSGRKYKHCHGKA